MKKLSNKLIIGIIVGLTVVGTASFVYFGAVEDSQKDVVVEKNRSVAFVTNTDNKMWYIKAKDCSDGVYEYMDTKKIFDKMCRIYTTDGEFVYYNGMRRIEPFPVIDPVFVDGKFASSSVSSRPIPKFGPFVIEGADSETFEVISSDYLDKSLEPKKSPTFTYSRDKNFLYREGERILGADPDTLLILGRGYIKDKDFVYYRGKKIDGSDAKTFEFLKYGYARDKNFVYLAWQGKKIEGSAGATFELLGGDGKYAKDSENVYYNKEKIEGADTETFELIYNGNTVLAVPKGTYTGLVGYTKDKNTVYYKGKKIEGSDPDTFIFVGGEKLYVKDKNFVYLYYGAEKLPWIDAKTFKHILRYYYKDQNTVYFGKGKILTGADPDTFEVLGGIYVKDKNFVWRSHYLNEGGSIKSVSVIEGANPETFVFLKNGYAKDKNFVYLNEVILPNIDSASVEILNNEYLKDKNSVYLRKEKIQGAEPKTFEVLSNGYVKDKNFVWFSFSNYEHGGLTSLQKIENVDTSSFEIINYAYTKDKNTVYYRGVALGGVDPNSFESFSICGYAKDNSKVFFIDQIGTMNTINDMDSASFEVVGRTCYSKDKNSVYFVSNLFKKKGSYLKAKGADSATFEDLGGRGTHAKDKNTVYYKGQQIVGADPQSFEIVKGEYWKDLSSVYYEGVKIEGADAKTFEVNIYGTIAKDKNTLYKKGEPITSKKLIDKDIILEPGFENPKGLKDIIVGPFGLEAIEIQELYPAGL